MKSAHLPLTNRLTTHKPHSAQVRQLRRWGATVLATGALLALTGCASTPPAEPEAAEIPLDTVTAVDTPEEALLAEAKRYYASELYTVARESFKSLAASYALGAYAEFAEIKAADAYFETNEFDVARTMYTDLMQNRPASRALPYLLFRAGRSFQLSHRGVGRDPAALEKALEFYDRLIATYPTSVYTDAARAHRLEVVRDLGQSERVVADFYARRQNLPAVAAREATIDQKWSPLMQVAHAATGVETMRYIPEAAPPSEVTTSAQANGPRETAAVSPPPVPTPLPGVSITRAVCQSGPPAQVYLALNQELPAGSAVSGSALVASPDAPLRLELPGVTSRGLTVDCFGSRDLTVSPTGVVELAGVARATIMSLRNPHRLLLIVER